MKRSLFSLVVLCGLTSLLACSAMHRRAEKLLENEAYEEAVLTYEQILKKDPNDTDAVVGLKKAREKFVDKRLIEVRNARLGNHAPQSLELLRDVVVKQKLWAFSPAGAVAYTQGEETAFALRALESQINGHLKANRALAASFWLTHFDPLLSADHAGMRTSLKDRTAKQGRDTCVDWQKKAIAGRYYLGEYISRYCGYFGTPTGNLKTKTKSGARDLFSSMRVVPNIEGVQGKFNPVFEGALNQVFQTSPWYSPEGPGKLTLFLSGTYAYEKSAHPVRLTHSYTVKEPYTDFEQVKKTRQEPHTVMDSKFDPASNSYIRVPRTEYRPVEYFERQPVTRFRDVPMAFPYPATEHTQNFEYNSKGDAKLGGEAFSFSHSGSQRHVGTEHNQRMPEIGLLPKSAELVKEDEWVTSQATKLGDSFRRENEGLWQRLYCNGAPGSLEESADRVHQCLRLLHANPPTFAEEWYKNNVALTVAQAQSLLGPPKN